MLVVVLMVVPVIQLSWLASNTNRGTVVPVSHSYTMSGSTQSIPTTFTSQTIDNHGASLSRQHAVNLQIGYRSS